MSTQGVTLPNEGEVLAEVEREIERMNRKIKRSLQYAGEVGVNIARDPLHAGTFTDRTGNLRSSIGSVVTNNAERGNKSRAYSDFPVVHNGADGAKEGRKYAKEVISEVHQPHALAVVAGKEYASYVAAKGYDVLDRAEIESRRTFEQLMKDNL